MYCYRDLNRMKIFMLIIAWLNNNNILSGSGGGNKYNNIHQRVDSGTLSQSLGKVVMSLIQP